MLTSPFAQYLAPRPTDKKVVRVGRTSHQRALTTALMDRFNSLGSVNPPGCPGSPLHSSNSSSLPSMHALRQIGSSPHQLQHSRAQLSSLAHLAVATTNNEGDDALELFSSPPTTPCLSSSRSVRQLLNTPTTPLRKLALPGIETSTPVHSGSQSPQRSAPQPNEKYSLPDKTFGTAYSSTLIPVAVLDQLRDFFSGQSTGSTATNSILTIEKFTHDMLSELDDHANDLGLPGWLGPVRCVFLALFLRL